MNFDVGDLMIAGGLPVDFTDRLMTWCGLNGTSFVLEAGCGTGKLGMNLSARAKCPVVLLDKDPDALDRAVRYVESIEALFAARFPVILRQGDLLKLPFHDGTFDLVFNEGVIEHFEDPLVPLREMARASSGWVAAIVPNARNRLQADMAKLQMERHKDRPDRWESYEKPMTQEELEGHLIQLRLSEVRSALTFPEKPQPSRDEYRMVIAAGRKQD